MTREDRDLLTLARHRKAVDAGDVWTQSASAWLFEANAVCLDALRRIPVAAFGDVKPYVSSHGRFENLWTVPS